MPALTISDPSYCSTKITAYSSTLKSSPTLSLCSVSLSTNPSPFPHIRALSLHTQLPSCVLRPLLPKSRSRTKVSASTMATGVQEVRPPSLDSTSDPPAIFDGTTRLYISYACPYAQRVWITRNCKGLQDKIKLVPIDLQNRPTWYKEKVYPPNKVPSLEHNNEVKGESLDLVKYIDSNFEGPSLFPSDPDKRQFAEELLSYTDSFNKGVITSFKADGMNDADAAFDYIETALSKFEDGPFFLGQFSLVDIAYAPFIERFQPFLLDVKKYDITAGRPKLATWIEEMNKNEAYKQTSLEPEEYIAIYKKRFLAQL
ncbi:glutathione S-transferase L3-like [Actinidia eriantha]|uniref:glutathione S-transferase L3-like n=1 Tax=Actinidia eriantha TaxID=165200 RepID=UPI002583B5F1|nr:glutathione S-transferase L3-like [Actinidia eriantha]